MMAAVWLGACRVVGAQGPATIEAEWSGTQSEVTERAEWVVTDPAQWQEVWRKTHTEIPPSPAPTIDFSRSMVIGAALGERTSGGYEVRMTEITDTGRELLVHVHESTPPPGAMTIMVLTQPYHLVRTRKTPRPVRFLWESPPDLPGPPIPDDGYPIQ